MLRGSMCRENRRKAVRGGSAACSILSRVLRLVTAEKSAFLLFWLVSDDAALSEAMVRYQQQRHDLLSRLGRRCCAMYLHFLDATVCACLWREPHIQLNASANAINRVNTNSCESRESNTPLSTSASLVHPTIIVYAVPEVPCQAPGFPWSTIAVHAPPPGWLRDCEGAIRVRIGS